MMHWPASGIMHLVSFLFFNFGYLPLQLIRERRNVSSLLDRSYLIFRFITLFMVMLSFVFKIQHWPGAGLLLIITKYLIPLYLAFYFYLRIKGRSKLPFQWNDLILAILAYMIHFYVTRTMVSPNVVDGYVILEEEYNRTNAGHTAANQLIYSSLDSAAASGNAELLESIRKLRKISDEIHVMNDTLKSGFISSFYTLPIGEGFDLATANRSLLASTSEGNIYFLASTRGSVLKSALSGYMKEIGHIQQRHHLPANLIGTGFDLEDITDPWGTTLSWEEYMFERTPIASVLTSLSWIEHVILLTERGTQNQLYRRLTKEETYRMLEGLITSESRFAMEQKEDEILRMGQQKELQRIQLEKSVSDLNQRNTLMAMAFAGIVFVLVLLTISTRAYMLKQKDNKKLALQKDEISGKNVELSMRNEEIMAQRDEIEAQRDEIEAQRDLVFNQKEEIEHTHNEISASIDYAMRLQDAMLPGTGLLENKFDDHLVYFRPKQKVSGDFYWWAESGTTVLVAVADCTGHGVPGAFMSLLGTSLLKEVVIKDGITQPGAILDRLREQVIDALNQKGAMDEQKDGMDLALVAIDTDTLKCEYAGANNPLYLVREGQLEEYKPDSMPLSHYANMDPFSTQEIQLNKGDQLYLFSDGYADQFGGKKRKKFKYKAFKQLILEHSSSPMQEQRLILQETMRTWQGKNEQIDDMVIVGIRI
jgi:serine phosphatase RsbU (regulator of sigma subunit)